MRGAISMAPMTTAAESAESPMTAITTDKPIIKPNHAYHSATSGGKRLSRI